jgi:hypothetical protein
VTARLQRAWQRSSSSGQASVELLGGLAIVLLSGLVAFQLLAVGYGLVMADHAAEAAALALANGHDPEAAVRSAVPGWPRAALGVAHARGRVSVTLFVPSPLRFLRERLVVSGEAAVRLPAGTAGRSG